MFPGVTSSLDGTEAAAAAAASTAGPLEALGTIRFPCPKPFDGKDENWEVFAIRLRNYLMQADMNFQLWMKESKDAADEIDFDGLGENQKKAAIMLQNALVLLCEGSSQNIVNRDEDNVNGFETWRRLWVRYSVQKRQKSTTRMTRVLQWNFKFTQAEFENDFEEWET